MRCCTCPYAKGFKSGGFNARPLTGIAEVQTPYDPEIVDSYEVGAKTSWFDRRVTANLAVFFNDYTDMQLTINATPQNFVRNAGEAEIKGAELEIVAQAGAKASTSTSRRVISMPSTRSSIRSSRRSIRR